jgi:plastocyanin
VVRRPALVLLVSLTLLIPGSGAYAAQETAELCPAVDAATSPAASPAASPATTEASPEASPQASPTGEACSIEMVDLAFSPAQTEIAVGTTVTWINNDTVPHTATESDGLFDSGVLDAGASFSFTFDEPGTYDYTCLIHPEMKGTIVVR